MGNETTNPNTTEGSEAMVAADTEVTRRRCMDSTNDRNGYYYGPCRNQAKGYVKNPESRDGRFYVCGVHIRKKERQGAEVIR